MAGRHSQRWSWRPAVGARVQAQPRRSHQHRLRPAFRRRTSRGSAPCSWTAPAEPSTNSRRGQQRTLHAPPRTAARPSGPRFRFQRESPVRRPAGVRVRRCSPRPRARALPTRPTTAGSSTSSPATRALAKRTAKTSQASAGRGTFSMDPGHRSLQRPRRRRPPTTTDARAPRGCGATALHESRGRCLDPVVMTGCTPASPGSRSNTS